ncbi:MAG: hypothetical protein LUD15_05015 [Bacteroides sp.]|nr:hypothetical protein [Bacteroides sp.]
MEQKKIITYTTVAVILLYIGVIAGWHIYTPERHTFLLHEPGADNRPEGVTRTVDDVVIGEYFMRYAEAVSPLSGRWSTFRGAERNNILVTVESLHTGPGEFPVV